MTINVCLLMGAEIGITTLGNYLAILLKLTSPISEDPATSPRNILNRRGFTHPPMALCKNIQSGTTWNSPKLSQVPINKGMNRSSRCGSSD